MPADGGWDLIRSLTLSTLTWRIWWAPNNAGKLQVGFNPAFKGLLTQHVCEAYRSTNNRTRSLLSRCLLDWSVWATSLAREVTGPHAPWLLLVLAAREGHGLAAGIVDNRRTVQSADSTNRNVGTAKKKGNILWMLYPHCRITCDVTLVRPCFTVC
jgi:hypothetical protein